MMNCKEVSKKKVNKKVKVNKYIQESQIELEDSNRSQFIYQLNTQQASIGITLVW